MAECAEAAQQGSSPFPFLTGSWTQHFAFNSMHMCFGAAATQGPASSSVGICHGSCRSPGGPPVA